jgi:hypothetical protein
MYITSADANSNGVMIYNETGATANINANIQNVRVLSTGATLNNRGIVFNNNNVANTIAGNVTNCNLTAYASTGVTDIALYVNSTTTNNVTVNAYNSVFDGADSDVTVIGTNSCTLSNCTLTHGTATGTVVYAGTQVVAKLNGNTITTGTGVLTLAAGKTLTASNSLTLAGTDATTHTFPTTSATIARTDAAQTFTGDQTLLANLVQGTAAKGFNFTANTPAAGMTSQLFNWYEEGTWTPTILGDSSAGSYSYDATRTAGKYTRIGKTVLLWAVIRPNVITVAGTGALCIGGFPFPAASRYASNMNSSDDIRVNIQGAGANVSAVTYPPPLTGSIDAGASTAVVASFGTNYSVTTVIGDLSGVNWVYLVSGSYTCA